MERKLERKFVLRVKSEKYVRLQAIAREKGMSANRLINALINQFLRRQSGR